MEEKNRELQIPTVYPSERNSGGGKPESVLETVMTTGEIFFKYSLNSSSLLPVLLLPFCTCSTSQAITVFSKLLLAGVLCFACSEIVN